MKAPILNKIAGKNESRVHYRLIRLHYPQAYQKFLVYTKDEASQVYFSSDGRQLLDPVKKPYAGV